MQEAISKQEFMELAKNLHRIYDIYTDLKSTKIQPGVYNNPYQ